MLNNILYNYFLFKKKMFKKMLQDIKHICHAFFSRYWLNYGPQWLQYSYLLSK